tara:strand:+ start:2841 stop:3377 length:537 start_codon:yes stop_codon:yes gene_type:complete
MILDPNETICFWGHTHGPYAFLSNFFPFEHRGDLENSSYCAHSSEQNFMMMKAELFKDHETKEKIIACKTAKEAKALGRQVKNFKNSTWSVCRQIAMLVAMTQKFGGTDLQDKLLDTGEKYLIEASPYDGIWGVGLPSNNPDIYDTDKWLGLNELGHCLMATRTGIRQEMENANHKRS